MAFWNLDTLKLEVFKPDNISTAKIGDNLVMVYMKIDRDSKVLV